MADIIINVELTQQFHDDFDMVTRNMLEALYSIKASFDSNCDMWQDESRQQFEELLTEMTNNLSVFIDTECQENLARLQELINRAHSVFETAKRLHKG